MSVTYETRPTVVMDLPLPEGTEVLRPEQVILRFSNGMTADIGSLCYLKRDAESGRVRSSDGVPVVFASRASNRVTAVRALIRNISEMVASGLLQTETIRDRYSRFLAFMAWADISDHELVLDGPQHAREAFSAYVEHLRDRVARSKLALNSGARQQDSVLFALQDFLGIEDLGRGLNLLRADHRSTQATSPPDEAAQGKVLSLCEAIWKGLTTLVLDGGQYPFPVEMPTFVGCANDQLWVFPTNAWFMSPSMLERRHEQKLPGWGYNYAEGRVSTLEEMRRANAREEDFTRRQVIRYAEEQIAEGNNDPQHRMRILAGVTALNCFVLMFLAETGMNWADLAGLPWSDDFKVDATHQLFRSVKYRAQGKEVSFELPVAFMPTFRRFLALRKFLLRGMPSERLFFRFALRGTQELTSIGRSPLTIYITLRRIHPELPKVMPREWRAAKSDFLVRTTDVATAALVLQNTERTVLQAYAAGSETKAMQEMGEFFAGVSKSVLEKGALVEGGIERAVGICAEFGAPVASHPGTALQPDCKNPEGCLFCDKYKAHADEKDTRKLASCRFCLREASSAMGTEERFQRHVSPVVKRIDELLGEIAQRDAEMAERIIQEVDVNGELDPYWARKAEMLMELGLMS